MTRRRGTKERREAAEPERTERGASWLAALIGMLTALGTALLLSGIIGGFVALVVAALSGGGTEGDRRRDRQHRRGPGDVVLVLPYGRLRGRARGEPPGY